MKRKQMMTKRQTKKRQVLQVCLGIVSCNSVKSTLVFQFIEKILEVGGEYL